MEFTREKYLIVYGVVVILLVGSYFFIRRRGAQPTQLDLRGDDANAADGARVVKEVGQKPAPKYADPRTGGKPLGYSNYKPRSGPVIEGKPRPGGGTLFNWNGHTWDAYEVLDLSPGAGLDKARAAYKRLSGQSDKETENFLKAALDAIANSSMSAL